MKNALIAVPEVPRVSISYDQTIVPRGTYVNPPLPGSEFTWQALLEIGTTLVQQAHQMADIERERHSLATQGKLHP